MKRRIRAADETEDEPLAAELPRDDLEHFHRPAARVSQAAKTTQEDRPNE